MWICQVCYLYSSLKKYFMFTSGPPKSYTKVHKTQKDQARQTNDKTHHPPNNSSTQHSCPFHDFNI